MTVRNYSNAATAAATNRARAPAGPATEAPLSGTVDGVGVAVTGTIWEVLLADGKVTSADKVEVQVVA